MIAPVGTNLYDALKKVGHELPEECVTVRIEMGVDEPYRIIYECNVTNELLAKIGAAFAEMGERR